MKRNLRQKKITDNEIVPEGLLEYHKNLIQHKKILLRLRKSVLKKNEKITKCLICEKVLDESDTDGICEYCRKSLFPNKQQQQNDSKS